MNIVVQKMIREDVPLTVNNYVLFAYWDRELKDLEGEELVEVQRLIEDGVLRERN